MANIVLNNGLSSTQASRVDWVDISKAFSIFLVVMMHSTLGVEKAMDMQGWMGAVVEFCRPFRIPAFMLISGLFLHKTIHGSWRKYLDRKILHFVYFYVLWVSIQFAFKTPAWHGDGQSYSDIAQTYLLSFIQPFGTLWFIYLLPVFYLTTRFTRNLSPWLMLGLAALLQIAPIHTGWSLIDEFCSRYIFFYSGYFFSHMFFQWSDWCKNHFLAVIALFTLWAGINLGMVSSTIPGQSIPWPALSVSDQIQLVRLPLMSLLAGFMGTFAIMALATLAANSRFAKPLKWVGAHSLIIYLAFFLPMGISRTILLKLPHQFADPGFLSLLVTLSAFIGPMIIYAIVRKIGYLDFLFYRPRWAKLDEVVLPKADKIRTHERIPL